MGDIPDPQFAELMPATSIGREPLHLDRSDSYSVSGIDAVTVWELSDYATRFAPGAP